MSESFCNSAVLALSGGFQDAYTYNTRNEVFSNAATKGREADGILDIFDRYNFTMSEDEPMVLSGKLNDASSGRLFRADFRTLQMCQSL